MPYVEFIVLMSKALLNALLPDVGRFFFFSYLG